jgi:hypothetical protein
MATVQIFHEEDSSRSTVTVNIASAILSTVGGSPADMVRDTYLLVTTTLRRVDGTAFPTFLVRDLSDTAPGSPAASDFTELVNTYIDYFVDQAELGQSSSSSSSSTSSEGYSESSSSSGGLSESSSSENYSESSSSSENYSESSSSSENYSESSSSEGNSESSSSEGNSESSSSSENYSESSSSGA